MNHKRIGKQYPLTSYSMQERNRQPRLSDVQEGSSGDDDEFGDFKIEIFPHDFRASGPRIPFTTDVATSTPTTSAPATALACARPPKLTASSIPFSADSISFSAVTTPFSAASIPFSAATIPLSTASNPSFTICSASSSALRRPRRSPKSGMSCAPAGISTAVSAAVAAVSSTRQCLRVGSATGACFLACAG
ncbi:cytoskeleton protein RodZ [Striga asiatica]|uniref:Cytoskeleton protein RodZ n=1 Tax=Striga asiatica TaxID=4170 RepID=A0A5A7PE46_STRAF|nr:cytoskeleton protein RodZ [Striga asiatica]